MNKCIPFCNHRKRDNVGFRAICAHFIAVIHSVDALSSVSFTKFTDNSCLAQSCPDSFSKKSAYCWPRHPLFEKYFYSLQITQPLTVCFFPKLHSTAPPTQISCPPGAKARPHLKISYYNNYIDSFSALFFPIHDGFVFDVVAYICPDASVFPQDCSENACIGRSSSNHNLQQLACR